eukprot:scaffold14905_cov32-Tisochrysis_lutea.AAC.1
MHHRTCEGWVRGAGQKIRTLSVYYGPTRYSRLKVQRTKGGGAGAGRSSGRSGGASGGARAIARSSTESAMPRKS